MLSISRRYVVRLLLILFTLLFLFTVLYLLYFLTDGTLFWDSDSVPRLMTFGFKLLFKTWSGTFVNGLKRHHVSEFRKLEKCWLMDVSESCFEKKNIFKTLYCNNLIYAVAEATVGDVNNDASRRQQKTRPMGREYLHVNDGSSRCLDDIENICVHGNGT